MAKEVWTKAENPKQVFKVRGYYVREEYEDGSILASDWITGLTKIIDKDDYETDINAAVARWRDR